MRELPLYNGAMPQQAQQRFTPVKHVPKVEQNGEQMDKAIGQVFDVIDKGKQLHDFSEQQQEEHLLRNLAQEREVSFAKRLELAPGADGSFFNADGSTNEEAVQGFQSEWQEKLEQVGGNYLLRESGMRAMARRSEESDRVAARVQMGVLTKELSNRRSVFEDNYGLAMKVGDYPGVERIVDGALAAGYISQVKADSMKFECRQQKAMQSVQEAYYAGAKSFAALYDDPEFRETLSPENAARFDAMAARLPLEVPARKVRSVTSKDGRTKLVAEAPEAPKGLPRGLVQVWQANNGDFDSVDAKAAARQPLMQYLRGLVQHAGDPAELEQAKAVCKAYGHSAEFATQVVGQLRSEIDGRAVFNAKEAMQAFSGKGAFFRPENQALLEGIRREYNALAGKTRSKEEKARFTELGEQLRKWEGYDKAETEKAQRAVFAKFDQWRQVHPQSSYREQARVFYEFVDGYSKDDATTLDAGALADEQAGIYDARVARLRDERRAAGEEMAADIEATDKVRGEAAAEADAEAAAAADEWAAGATKPEHVSLNNARGVSRSWPGDATDAILYVPKGHAMAGREVRIGTPDDVQSFAVVREQEGCDVPVMSQALRLNLGLLNNPYSTLSFDGNEGKLGRGVPVDRKAKALGGLAPYYETFVDAAMSNGLEPRLLMAIAMHETGRGTSSAFRNKKNAMGVSDSRGPRRFGSVEESIYYMADQLRRNYIGKGLQTVEAIGRKYAPVGAANDPRGLNQHWVNGVNKYMRELN
ncbi:MAG: glucosaminidase domain-containing protein [Akkermansia sp.]|nr:glucosaminidase domain-containing protein [Akkermansia sp.]